MIIHQIFSISRLKSGFKTEEPKANVSLQRARSLESGARARGKMTGITRMAN